MWPVTSESPSQPSTGGFRLPQWPKVRYGPFLSTADCPGDSNIDTGGEFRIPVNGAGTSIIPRVKSEAELFKILSCHFDRKRSSGVPDQTRRVARAAFPKGCVCLRVGDALGRMYQDKQFTALFPRRGQPAEA